MAVAERKIGPGSDMQQCRLGTLEVGIQQRVTQQMVEHIGWFGGTSLAKQHLGRPARLNNSFQIGEVDVDG